ncbi:hypothetical protein A4X09_0g5384 [Tilletia walkeri]|uniref:Reverse transcriptase n=1 Tax=Tilletia walkeri TaxID=117179 RepID=A0A8X7N5W9_9BASI|nr:hypothetical protein A4X09_0g5384 [Tilletia walkeri]
MSSNTQESASNIPSPRLLAGAGRSRITRSVSSSIPSSGRQSTPRGDGTDRGKKRASPDFAVEATLSNPSGSQLRDAVASEQEEETRIEEAASESSGLGLDDVRKLLLISGQQTQQDMRELLAESERRQQQQIEAAEQRHRDEMDILNAQSQARTDQLLEVLRTQSRSPQLSQAPPVQTPLPRRPRFSSASNLVFGAEDEPLIATLAERVPPHHLPRTPYTPSAARRSEDAYPHLRAAKSKDMGVFKPEEGQLAYSWWMGLMQYRAFSKVTDEEIFMGLPGCFESGRAKEFFNGLTPRPTTLDEFWRRLFSYFNRDESQIRDDVKARLFQPDQEGLAKYLDDKYRLISELHVARIINRGPATLDFSASATIMTSETVADVINSVHADLPPHWSVFLDSAKDSAQDWPQYRAAVLAKEQRTKAALSLLKGPSNQASRTPIAARTAPMVSSLLGPPEEEEVHRLDVQLGRCFNCHTADHAKRDCPRLQTAVSTVRQILARLENEEDEDELSHLVRSIGTLATDDEITDIPAEHRRLADDDDDVSRVRYARRVSISLESSPVEPALCTRATGVEKVVELPGRRHRDVVAHKVAVHVGNDKERFELHVDGGSPLSMITARALRTISPDTSVLPPEPLRIKGYRGEDTQRPIVVVLLPIYFPTSNDTPAVQHRFEFHVVEECTGGWILGVDNIKADGIDALSKRERLIFERRPDAEVRLLQATHKQTVVGCPNHLVCARRTMISAHTARLVAVDPVTTDRVVHPWWFTHDEAPTGFVKVPSCIVGPNTRAVEVFNTSDVDVEFKEGDVLGETSELGGEIESVDQLEDAISRTRGPTIPQLSRSLHDWKRRSNDHTVRRVVFTNAEPDGGDVLPEIDMPAPKDRVQSVCCSSRLNKEQRARLSKVLEAHAVWPTPKRPLGLYEDGEVSLRLRAGQESWTHAEPPRRTSPAQKDVIDETIREHESLGISEPSQGPYASGVVLVQQRDKIRFCNDYRPLNKVTVDDYYAMPTIDTIYDQLGGSRFFTVVDANKGYYQFLLDQESRDLTGFITFRGLRRYRRLPFGLKQAPSWFQRAMDRILGSARWVFALAYLDDVVIYSRTFSEHLEHLDTILAAIERAGLTISPAKCRFAFESVALLGYRVSSLGLMTDPEKLRAVREFPEPTNAAEARRFFAMAAWYRRFIAKFAGRARAINKSFIGDTFVWGPEAKAAFDDIKLAMADTPILKSPDFRHPFILSVDASVKGLGGVLSQDDEHGVERPILFISRQTTDGEKKYAPTHLELAAIWWCVKKLQHYIDGSRVEVRTDHNALRWLWDLKPSDIHETRVQKFKMALTPLEDKITITYNRGQNNVVADALSRAPLPDRTTVETEQHLSFVAREYQRVDSVGMASEADLVVRAVSIIRLHSQELESWAAAYAADPRWRRIWKRALSRSQAVADDGDLFGGEDKKYADVGEKEKKKEAEVEEKEETELEEDEEETELKGEEETELSTEEKEETELKEEEETELGTEEKKDVEKVEEQRFETVHFHRSTGGSVRRKSPPTAQQVSTRTLRPRTILAVHRSSDDDLYFIREGLLFVKIKDGVRLCVPVPKLNDLIHEYHVSIRSGHPSIERTIAAMSDHVFAHDLAQRVAAHVRVCYECQVNKAHRHKEYGDMQPIVTPHKVFDTQAMDFITGLPRSERGHDSILVVVDKYTRFAFFLPNCTTDTAEMVAFLFFERVFPITGLPKAIISDRDAKFTSQFWSALMKNLDIKLRMSTAYHPQTDGLVERLNAQLETMLRHYVAIDQHDWDLKLAALSMAYNSQRQESTKQSPYLMAFGRDPAIFPLKTLTRLADPAGLKVNDLFGIHADAQQEMEMAQERQRRAYSSRH